MRCRIVPMHITAVPYKHTHSHRVDQGPMPGSSRLQYLCDCVYCQGKMVPMRTRTYHRRHYGRMPLGDSQAQQGGNDNAGEAPDPPDSDSDDSTSTSSSDTDSDSDTSSDSDRDSDPQEEAKLSMILMCRELMELVGDNTIGQTGMEKILKILTCHLGPMLPSYVTLPRSYHLLSKTAGSVKRRSTRPVLCPDKGCGHIHAPGNGLEECESCGTGLLDDQGAPIRYTTRAHTYNIYDIPPVPRNVPLVL